MSYATDGHCHNVEPGTDGHECGKPAQWLGTTGTGYQSLFCDHCRQHGYEARTIKRWQEWTDDDNGLTYDDLKQFYGPSTMPRAPTCLDE